MPTDHPRAFFIFKMLQNKSSGKNYAWKYVKVWCLLPEKIAEIAAEHENISQRACYVFFGSNAFLVNIQPDSKFHLPHQNFMYPLPSARSSFFLEPPLSLKHAECAPGLYLHQPAKIIVNIKLCSA